MRVTPQLAITDARLTSHSVPEPDASMGEAVWSSLTTYALNQQAISTVTHRIYESRQAGNLNHALPADDEIANDWWLDIGPTNRHRMFDLYRNTATTSASPLSVTITPGKRVNTLVLTGLRGTEVVIEQTSGGDIVYSETIKLRRRRSTGWYSYFYGAFSEIPSVARFDLRPYTNSVITITIIGGPTGVACGGLTLGSFIYLGDVQWGADADALNFSKIDRDSTGKATLVPKRTIPKNLLTLWCPKGNVNKVREVRTLLNAVPAVWSALDDSNDGYFETLLIVGIYKQLSINATGPDKAIIKLETEEI